MKKVLIVKPDYQHLPLGLAYVMASLRENNIPYEYVDTVFDKTQWSQRLASDDYFMVATGGLCGDFNSIRSILQLAKEVNPGIATLLGGSISHDCPSQLLMDMMPLDYQIIGECEGSLPHLLREVAKGNPDPKRLMEIRGIAFNNLGTAYVTPPAKPISLKDNRLFPVWEDITNIQYYIDLVRVPGLPNMTGLPVLTGRGCTGKCSFCSPTLGSFRTRPIDEVMEELHLHHESGYNFDGFLFLNEMFYPSLKTVKEFTKAYKDSGIGRPWQCSMRVDMPLECLELMKDAGCVIVGVGYESGNNDVLKRMRKRTSTDLVRKFLRKSKEVGLYTYATFMFGSEGETEKEIAQTMDLLLEEKTYGGGACVTIYPGTKIYDNAYEKGLFTDKKKHLETLDFFNSAIAGNILKPEYINISDIPDKLELNTVALRHYSRYRGGIHRHFNIEKPNRNTVTGACPTCGADVDMHFYVNTMFLEHTSCPECHHPVFLDFYHHPPFEEHKQKIKKELEGKNRIAVVGQGVNSLGLLTTNVFINDPTKVAMVIGDHPLHDANRFLIHPVISMDDLNPDDVDYVLIADADSLKDTARKLVELGLADRANTIMAPGWPEFVKDIKERSVTPWDAVRLYFPSPDKVHQCQNLYERIACHLVETRGKGTRCCLAPAGSFSVNMAVVLEQYGLKVTAFMDNFLEEKEIGGKPIYKAADLDELPDMDTLLVATPNCRTQELIANGIKERFGDAAADKVSLMADIYLEKYIDDHQRCLEILETNDTKQK